MHTCKQGLSFEIWNSWNSVKSWHLSSPSWNGASHCSSHKPLLAWILLCQIMQACSANWLPHLFLWIISLNELIYPGETWNINILSWLPNSKYLDAYFLWPQEDSMVSWNTFFSAVPLSNLHKQVQEAVAFAIL